MSELFGAPSGVIAWDQNARENALAQANVQNLQVTAQQKLSQLSMAPDQLALLRAQAREQNSLADQHEIAANIQRQQLGFEDLYKAQQKLQDTASLRGQMATWQDLPDVQSERNADGTQSQRTMAQMVLQPQYSITKPLEDKLAFLQKAGAPTVMMSPLIKEIADVKEKAAIADYRSSQAGEQKQKQQLEQMKSVGGMAQAASEDPDAYEQLRMTLASNQDPRVRALSSKLTGDFRTDSPKLAAFAQSTLDAQQQITNTQKDDKLQLENDQLEVSKGKAKVQAMRAAAQVTVLNARAAVLNKEEGTGTVNQEALNDQKRYTAYQRDLKDREAKSPPAPLDPNYYLSRPNSQQTYTLKNGAIARPVIQNGKVMWDVVKPPLKEVAPPRSIEDIASGRKASRAAAMEDESDDMEP